MPKESFDLFRGLKLSKTAREEIISSLVSSRGYSRKTARDYLNRRISTTIKQKIKPSESFQKIVQEKVEKEKNPPSGKVLDYVNPEPAYRGHKIKIVDTVLIGDKQNAIDFVNFYMSPTGKDKISQHVTVDWDYSKASIKYQAPRVIEKDVKIRGKKGEAPKTRKEYDTEGDGWHVEIEIEVEPTQ